MSHYSMDSSFTSNFTPQKTKIENKIKERIKHRRHVRFSSFKKFSPIFWIICVMSMIEKMTITPFIQNSSEMFQMKFNLEIQETGTIIAIPFIVYIFLAPFLGIMMDKIGNRGYILIVGFLSLFFCQLIFLNFEKCPPNDKCY